MSRTDIPKGTGMYAYVLPNCEGGDMGAMVEKAVKHGISWIAPRVVGWCSPDPRNTPYLLDELGAACRANGVRYGGWGYHVGLNADLVSIAKQEALMAAEVIDKYGLDFYVLNAEKEYKIGGVPWAGWKVRPNSALRAAMTDFWFELRLYHPDLCMGMTSYRFPKWHPEFVWEQALDPKYCDFNQPQVYAVGDPRPEGPILQLMECDNQFSKITDLPMVPLFATYKEGGWSQTYEQTLQFIDEGLPLIGAQGSGGYAWEFTTQDQWKAIAELSTGPPLPPDPEPDPGPEPIKCVRVTSFWLTLRKEASAKSAVQGFLIKGATVEVLKTVEPWGLIASGLWIHLNYTAEVK